jgi:hypothetical protein
MGFNAFCVVDGRPSFNVMESYYRMFPQEVSNKQAFTYNLTVPTRIKNMTFESLVDKMSDLLRTGGGIDNFVIVVHGLYDHSSDYGKGLSIPLTANSGMKASYDILELLLNHRNGGSSQSAMDSFETNYSYTNKSLNLSDVHFPKGSVSRIVGKMAQLQRLKPRIVEMRACNLGTNTAGMKILGESLGARFLLAPDRRMFFVSVSPTVNNDKTFDAYAGRLTSARVFVNPLTTSERLLIRIQKGQGTNRLVDTTATSRNLNWFTDRFLWSNGNYVSSTSGKPRTFYLEGMDLPGSTPYAMPHEQVFSDHIIEVGPLAGNMI